MAEGSNISWTDDTFNPWEGCQKVGPGCDGCYAEARNIRYAEKGATEAPNWGPGAPRRRTSAANWRKPLKWQREQAEAIAAAVVAGLPPPPTRFVFCASLADVFDNAVPVEWRQDLFRLIRETPDLTWLLLTKRPGNIVKLWSETLADESGQPLVLTSDFWPRNAAIGCTVVTQEEADRDVPKLLAAKAALQPALAFLSMEPLLGPVDLTPFLFKPCPNSLDGIPMDPETGVYECCRTCDYTGISDEPEEDGVDWVITGGETDQGHHRARPAHPAWFRALRDLCAETGVAFHHKQNGEWVGTSSNDGTWPIETPKHIRLNVDGSLSATGWPMQKVGKGHAGRMLDGREHDDRPTPRGLRR